ncbi:transglutaminase-like cysteine peptidase [Amphritea balenae]|uniref:transglutaminase-like cysteine peptidase n=1 Tax=Amphritea balenae TaxID=452629 RepID=UPI001475F99C|nr:transglutaminase-like cysteine peptidase [Amphritea balenae]
MPATIGQKPLRLLVLFGIFCCQPVFAFALFSPAPDDHLYQRWQALLETPAGQLNTAEKLRLVDEFVNQVTYSPDRIEQGMTDYWLSPDEFFRLGRGDCEDFAIAKFFGLLALGVPEASLKLVYGRLPETGLYHVLLQYQPDSGAEPLLLDNLTLTPTVASKRTDFKPLYSFDRNSVWFMDGWQSKVRSSTPLNTGQWQRVLSQQSAGREWLALR